MTLSNLPSFYQMPCTLKGEQFSTDFHLYLDEQFQFLNSVTTAYGVKMPSFTNAEVLVFPDAVSVGTVWYNSTLDKLQFKGALAVQTIQSV